MVSSMTAHGWYHASPKITPGLTYSKYLEITKQRKAAALASTCREQVWSPTLPFCFLMWGIIDNIQLKRKDRPATWSCLAKSLFRGWGYPSTNNPQPGLMGPISPELQRNKDIFPRTPRVVKKQTLLKWIVYVWLHLAKISPSSTWTCKQRTSFFNSESPEIHQQQWFQTHAPISTTLLPKWPSSILAPQRRGWMTTTQT